MEKKTRVIITVIIISALVLVGAFCIASCFMEEGTGRVELREVSIKGAGDLEDAGDYDITRLIVRAERDGRGTTEEVMSLPHDLGELREGKWTIMVDAYDSRGNFISTCSADVNVDHDDILELGMAFDLPDPAVDVPYGRLLRVEPHAPFTLKANYRPMKTSSAYSYIWTFWPVDTPSSSTHVVDMHSSPELSSDAFWQIWEWYRGRSNEFQYSVDVTGSEGSASFSGMITVVDTATAK